MTAYIIRRILGMIPLLIIVSIVTFFIIQLPPGDFFTTLQAEIAESGEGRIKKRSRSWRHDTAWTNHFS